MKRLIPAFFLVVYSALLVKVLVFKDLPAIRIGHLMFNFGGTTEGGQPANFVPFATIVPYMFGEQGMVIAGVNMVGNIALLVPIGLLAALVFKKFTWQKALAVAAAAGLTVEIMQAVLRLGIFDIDDVILNALGVMVGYGAFVIMAKLARSKKRRENRSYGVTTCSSPHPNAAYRYRHYEFRRYVHACRLFLGLF